MKKDSSDLLLFDVNVLLALAWPNHQFHESAMRRLEADSCKWATCALTELGFVRLSSNPSVVGVSKSPAEVAGLLSRMVADTKHAYLDLLPSPVSRQFLALWEKILGSRQVMDVYLLTLARANNATLVTFDTRIPAISDSSSVEVLS
jgi:uncharacterized protein